MMPRVLSGALLALACASVSDAADAAKARQPQAPAPAPASAGLPGGASALSEAYSGWGVNCRVVDGDKRCSMSHQERSNGRALLTIEVRPKEGASTPATMLLPFGLAVTKGVTLAVDDQKPAASRAFSTCLPGGCLVPLVLDQAFVSQLSAGAVLKIAGTVADSQKPIVFPVPLDGFSAAYARLGVLSAD